MFCVFEILIRNSIQNLFSYRKNRRSFHSNYLFLSNFYLFISGKTALVRRYTEGNSLQFVSCPLSARIVPRNSGKSSASLVFIAIIDKRIACRERILREHAFVKRKGKEMHASRLIRFNDTCVKRRSCDIMTLLIRTSSAHTLETVFSREVLLELQDYHRRRFCDKNTRLGSAN